MTYLGTRETREAAKRASAAEREHRGGCIACIRATRHRRPDGRCAEGSRLLGAKREADAQLKTERELDKIPIPGQEALFRPEEV